VEDGGLVHGGRRAGSRSARWDSLKANPNMVAGVHCSATGCWLAK